MTRAPKTKCPYCEYHGYISNIFEDHLRLEHRLDPIQIDKILKEL